MFMENFVALHFYFEINAEKVKNFVVPAEINFVAKSPVRLSNIIVKLEIFIKD